MPRFCCAAVCCFLLAGIPAASGPRTPRCPTQIVSCGLPRGSCYGFLTSFLLWLFGAGISLTFGSAVDLPFRADEGYPRLSLPSSGWQFRPAVGEKASSNADAKPGAVLDAVAAQVPAPWEDFMGLNFDGRGTYTLALDAAAAERIQQWRLQHEANRGLSRLYVVFDGVATEATVRLNGQVLGAHLGPWTPWDGCVDGAWNPAGPNVLEVEVDERVGHHTQGFLPVFLPHFGGIWQPVRWELRPVQRIDSTRALVLGDYAADGQHGLWLDVPLSPEVQAGQQLRITVEVPRRWVEYQASAEVLEGGALQPVWREYPGRTERQFTAVLAAEQIEQGRWRQRLSLPDAVPWSPSEPWLYGVRVELCSRDAEGGATLHAARFRTGFRRYETRDHQLLLNGQPVVIQGVLNWGYTPYSLAPTLDERVMRAELEAARRMGANLMKFCLWIPPRRYLELADEMGMLTWIEYPTWHAQLVQANLAELSREYTEFTDYDRNHPSVILRSLTCETGPSAELPVIQHLYDLVQRQVPGAIVEDDSSWISWNRVSDIWDDHPYGNNHTWVKTLQRLREFIDQREAKPLILGEAIAADTWPDLRGFVQGPGQRIARPDGESRPFWYFGFLEAAQAFEQQLAAIAGQEAVERLHTDSVRYAYLMRKYQVETYRREVPWGGYVLSVIRDFPFAAMGLLDTFGQPKFPDWDIDGPFQLGPATLVLQTPGDRRSWFSGQSVEMGLLLATEWPLPVAEVSAASAAASAGDVPAWDSRLEWQLRTAEADGRPAQVLSSGREAWQLRHPIARSATSADHPRLDWRLELPVVEQATEVVLSVTLKVAAPSGAENAAGSPANETRETSNQWSLWLLPEVPNADTSRLSVVFASELADKQRSWFEQAPLSNGIELADSGSEAGEPGSRSDGELDESGGPVVVASRFSPRLLERLESGARVLMLPDGGNGSFMTQEHWFLRGGPIVFDHPMLGSTPVERRRLQAALRDLQHFDLGGPVQPRFDLWTESSPVLMLWDNHDIKEVRTHGLLWEAQVGRGRLLVSLLNHDPATSAIGPYLLGRALEHLQRGPAPAAWSEALVQRLRSDLLGQEINLTGQAWYLRPDGENVGFEQGWSAADVDDTHWSPIRIDAHWDGQGHAALDGWAWYATEVQVPEDWSGESLYLCFTGVDDHYRVFVDGQEIGSAGDIKTRATAFELRTSHPLPEECRPGQVLRIRVAVYDWYGAGGIFRPVYLRTTPFHADAPLLKR